MIVEYESPVVQQITRAQWEARRVHDGVRGVALSLTEARRLVDELASTSYCLDPERDPVADFAYWLMLVERGLDASPQPEIKVAGIPIKVLR